MLEIPKVKVSIAGLFGLFLLLVAASSSVESFSVVVVVPTQNKNNNIMMRIIPMAVVVNHHAATTTRKSSALFAENDQQQQIVSPFDHSSATSEESSTTTPSLDTVVKLEGPLDLTWENVDLVLDEMRPFLIQDGGNVKIQDIDGPVVKLQLEGACGTCPSSTQTMKMGLERGLREKIPEIQEVIQAMPEGPNLDEEQVNVILDGVRPFLSVAGGTIDIERLEGVGGLQPTIWLKMEGTSSTLNSVKLEIAQRLQRHFMMAGLRIEWA